MATRFKSTDLQSMIRSIVRQEMNEVVKSAINEVLSERYLKQLAESAVGHNRPRGVSNLMIQGDEDEEEVQPEILGNRNAEDGIYVQHPIKKEGIDRNDMLSLFFENTKPINEVEAEAEEGIPLALDEKPVAEMASKWRRLVEGANALDESRRPMSMPKNAEMEEARLKMLRESLERKA